MNKENFLTSAKQIKVGSYVVESFANSLAFYKVMATTDKSVTLLRVQDEMTHFENAGGPTGYRYCKPTDKPYCEYDKPFRKICRTNKDGSISIPGIISRWNCVQLYNPNHEYSEYYE